MPRHRKPVYFSPLICFFVLFLGCNDKDAPGKKVPQKKPHQSPSAGVEKDPKLIAQSVLTTTLDSWVFKDSTEKFDKAHPEIHFSDPDWIQAKLLLRYEIGNSRPYSGGFQFSVILVFESKSGIEIKRNAVYTVLLPGKSKKWLILGGAT